jgi:hypothetical protein
MVQKQPTIVNQTAAGRQNFRGQAVEDKTGASPVF